MKQFYFLLFAAVLLCRPSGRAQELILNGDFAAQSANWTTGCTTVEAYGFESTYGGTNTTNRVAEVDDESCFFQNVCVLPGSSYIFAMKASRRTIAAATMTTTLKIEGLNAANTVVGAPLVNMDFTRSNTTFALTPVTGIPTVVVPAATGIVRLKISLTDNTSGYATLGMVVDDLSLTFLNAPTHSGDTVTCTNTPTQLGIANVGGPGIVYNWNLGAGASPATSTAASPTVTWSTTGTKNLVCYLSNGTCYVDTVSYTVEVGNATPPSVTSPINYCTGQFAPPLSATGTGLRWYTASAGGTPLPSAPQPSTANPGTTTWYVTAGSGPCESVRVPITVIVSPGATAAFTYLTRFGCGADTVIFTNNSTGGGTYTWDFGDNTGSGAVSPVHVYTNQQLFNVKLKNDGGYCKDSVVQTIDLLHPLTAAFSASSDTICQGMTVQFNDASVTTSRNGIDPRFYWDFGDGDTSQAQNPSHTFSRTGVFRVLLLVTDFVPCTDTESIIIYVDSAAGLSLFARDTVICAGSALTIVPSYLPSGFRSITWDLGDNSVPFEENSPVQHAYELPGSYTVTATADYRICPDTTVTLQLRVKPYPQVQLGRDTFLCPNAAPIRLVPANVSTAPGTTWRWNTGDTTSGITARQSGTYWVTATLDGCSTTDSQIVYKDCYVDIPNAFTPNGDGTNNMFFPRQLLSRGVTTFHMQVYDRWGQMVFETARPDGRGWDGSFNGEPQPAGVYIYVIDAAFKSGRSEHYQGNVTLLR